MNIDHKWSLIITVHTWWSLIMAWKTVDHAWNLLIMLWKAVDHTWSTLIIAMKDCWSFMINIDRCIISWPLLVVTITFMMTWLCNTSCMINSPFTAMINKYHAWSIAYHSMINRFHAWSTAFHSMINKFHAWSIAYHSMINKFHTWSTWSMIMNDHCSLISYMINSVHKAMINYQAHFLYH